MAAEATKFDSKRFAAVALLAVLLLSGVLWIVWVSVAASATQDQVEQQRAQLASLIQRSKGLLEDTGEVGSDNQLSVYFPGETQAIAGALVQRTVDEIVGGTGGHVVESQILPVDPGEEASDRIDLKTSFESDIVALQKALYEIETHLPMMMVRSLTVRSFVTGGPRDSDAENPNLQIALVVSGFWKAEPQ